MQLTALLAGNVWRTIGGVAIAIVILLVMVTIHEFGHYIAGKALGFKINEFSVGFGPAIFKKRSKKTGEIFALRVIPLGGYCAFDGEDYEEETEKEEVNEPLFEEFPKAEEAEEAKQVESIQEDKEEVQNPPEQKEEEYPEPKGEKFNDQPPWKRIIVLVAGATMNYLLALFLIVLMFGIYGLMGMLMDNMVSDVEEHISTVYVQNAPEGFEELAAQTGYDKLANINYLAADTSAEKMQELKDGVLNGGVDLLVIFDKEFLAKAQAYANAGDPIPSVKVSFNSTLNYSSAARGTFNGMMLGGMETTLLQNRFGNLDLLTVFNSNSDLIIDEEKAG